MKSSIALILIVIAAIFITGCSDGVTKDDMSQESVNVVDTQDNVDVTELENNSADENVITNIEESFLDDDENYVEIGEMI